MQSIEGSVEVSRWPLDCSIVFYQPKRIKKILKGGKSEGSSSVVTTNDEQEI